MFVTSDNVKNDTKLLAAKENFYKPLCLDGYLTPLQRKKLREKRNCQLTDGAASEETFESKRSRPRKRKKERSSFKSEDRPKKRKTKESTPRVQIVLRTLSNGNRFFRASSPNRLRKACFTMPLVYDRNALSKVGRSLASAAKKRQRKGDAEEASSAHDALIISENHGANEESGCDASDASREKSVFDFEWPEDEQLLKRQERARALLRMQRDSKEDPEPNPPEKKLYPIFYVAAKNQSKNKQEIKSKKKNACKKSLEPSKGEQLIIDAGQKEIGPRTCPTCNMLYTVGQAEDERLHCSYHETYLGSLKFPGWKEENVIGEYTDGRVILLKKNDKAAKIKKMEDVLMIANRDLGFPSSQLPEKPDLTFVLFISNSKQVAGFLIAEPISSACRVLLGKRLSDDPSAWKIGEWYASSEAEPAICGVNRIWVAHTFRRQRIASRMMDCLRCSFIYGHRLGIRQFAFTDPSPNGREFAASYTGTNNFLVYK